MPGLYRLKLNPEMKNKILPPDFITWADISLLAALFGFDLEQKSMRRAIFVNKERGTKFRRIAQLTPNGWRVNFS